jgi:hypothetical protein
MDEELFLAFRALLTIILSPNGSSFCKIALAFFSQAITSLVCLFLAILYSL